MLQYVNLLHFANCLPLRARFPQQTAKSPLFLFCNFPFLALLSLRSGETAQRRAGSGWSAGMGAPFNLPDNTLPFHPRPSPSASAGNDHLQKDNSRVSLWCDTCVWLRIFFSWYLSKSYIFQGVIIIIFRGKLIILYLHSNQGKGKKSLEGSIYWGKHAQSQLSGTEV